MSTVSAPPAGAGIVFRCDGNEQIGAGHVARCLPLAAALAQLGWKVSFTGLYEGLARWLLARAEMEVRAPEPQAPCGISAGECHAAVIDSYLIAPSAICELARERFVVTLAEANRCPQLGVLLDYHLDRSETHSDRLLAGPSYAPLDPVLAGAGCPGTEVRRILVSVGGSAPARGLLAQIAPIVISAFPQAELVLAGGTKSETKSAGERTVIESPSPRAPADLLPGIDLAVTSAGLTAYELCCAGVSQVAIAIVANQRRVVNGLQKSGLAVCLDLTRGDSLADLPAAVRRLRDVGLRRRLAKRGMEVFDGQGARRAAIALTELYRGSNRCE
jgi:spore coat polysaccharide biosynthesis predicted glycosyltransferase SpsG